MRKSISFHQGHKSNLAHNNRENVHGNPDIDPSRLEENIYFVQRDIREVYEEVFQEAVDAYNAKQSRKDRKIENYFDKIRNDSKTHEQRELIVAIGKGDDGEEFRSLKKSALIEYAKEFQERNPNLAVYNMVLHDDEANPHLHINYVPNFESKRGLTRRVGMDKALHQQGIGLDVKENSMKLIGKWRDLETARIEELAKEHIERFERANVGSHKYMNVRQYKEYAESLHTLQAEVESQKADLKAIEGVKEVEKAKLDDLEQQKKELQAVASKLAESSEKAKTEVKALGEQKKALVGEIEANTELIREQLRRTEKLITETKEKNKPTKYRVGNIEPIYKPLVKQGKNVKMDLEEYNKMLESQRKFESNFDKLADHFNDLADKYYKSETEKQTLAVELEKTSAAVPVQNDYFVPREQLEEKEKEYELLKKSHQFYYKACLKVLAFVKSFQEKFPVLSRMVEKISELQDIKKVLEEREQVKEKEKEPKSREKENDEIER